ncbi:protein PF3D7_1417600-like [Parasteatoda tepidariorum]|uniref:protein PF3D7_1417600-like n=1 Tax=Parasteatoda tepidariorum TaxID=114398 RepID=UPI001C71D486|nr:uncharacterized protein LOC107438369 [Parasteatoda tepidariorum]
MKRISFVRSLFLLPVLNTVSSFQLSSENLLRRAGKPISWKWNENLLKTSDAFRRRRFLGDESSQPWWKEIHSDTQDFASSGSATNPLTSAEDTLSEKLQHTPPFDSLENLPAPLARIESEEVKLHPHREIEEPLLGEVIIDELHRPSKLELESATKRLKDISSNSLTGQVTSSVEYVVPSIELVEPHVEYANPFEVITTTPSIIPEVEYVEPSVEFVEPVIEYDPRNNFSENYSIVSFGDEGSGLEDESFSDENLPVEESIRIGRKELLRLYSHKEDKRSYLTKSHSESEKSERFSTKRRFYRHQPIIGVPEESYPTLEILPVVHFACEEYAEPGYYADISSRCQMFHICHDNGMRSSFLCPVGTVFNQEYLVCDWWYNVDCRNSVRYHSPLKALNSNKEQLLASGSGTNNDHGVSSPTNSSSYFSDKKSPIVKKFNNITNETMKLKSSKNKFNTLSKKAINYPIGYAILLREHIKSSAQKLSDQSLDAKESVTLDKKPDTIEFVENVNAIVKFKKRLRSRPKPKNHLRQKQTFFGGTKPFADIKIPSSVKPKSNTNVKQRENDSSEYETSFNGYNVENMTLYHMVPKVAKFSAVHRGDERKNENLELLSPSRQKHNNRNNTIFDHAYWEKVFAANNFSSTYDNKLNYDVVKSTLSYVVSETSEIGSKVYNLYSKSSSETKNTDENLALKSPEQYSFEETIINESPVSFMNQPREIENMASKVRIKMESGTVKNSFFKYGDRISKINKPSHFEKPEAKGEFKEFKTHVEKKQSSPRKLALQDIQVRNTTQSNGRILISDESVISKDIKNDSEANKIQNSIFIKAIKVDDHHQPAFADKNVTHKVPAYLHQYVKYRNNARPNESYFSIRRHPELSQDNKFHSNITAASNQSKNKALDDVKKLYYIDYVDNLSPHNLSSKATPSDKVYYVTKVSEMDSYFQNVTKINTSNGGYKVIKKVKIKRPSPSYFMLPERNDKTLGVKNDLKTIRNR